MSNTITPPDQPDFDHVQITLLVKLNPAIGTGEQRQNKILTTARHLAAILAEGEHHQVIRADVMCGKHLALHAGVASNDSIEDLAAQLRHDYLVSIGFTEHTPWVDLLKQTDESNQRDVEAWRDLARKVTSR